MYHYILGASLFKSITPYVRKNILDTIDSRDLLYLDAFMFFIIVLSIFVYKCVFDKNDIINTISNYQRLTYKQFLCAFVLSLISVMVVYFILELDKFHNTPLINYISRVSLTSVFAIMIGILYFKEKYKIQHVVGILVILFGIYLATFDSV